MLDSGGIAASTRRAYTKDFAALRTYLRDHGHNDEPPIDPTLVVEFISAESRAETRPGRERPARSLGTIRRRVSAIAKTHQLAELPDPTQDERVRDAMADLHRRLREAPKRTHADIEPRQVEQMVESIPSSTHAGRRDRALLLVGSAGALRGGELLALNVADIHEQPAGIILTVRNGRMSGRPVAATAVAIGIAECAALCPVRALHGWLDAAGIVVGPVFRRVHYSDHVGPNRLRVRSAAEIIKLRAARIGLDPDTVAGNSLRTGAIAAATRRDQQQAARLSRYTNLGSASRYEHRTSLPGAASEPRHGDDR